MQHSKCFKSASSDCGRNRGSRPLADMTLVRKRTGYPAPKAAVNLRGDEGQIARRGARPDNERLRLTQMIVGH